MISFAVLFTDGAQELKGFCFGRNRLDMADEAAFFLNEFRFRRALR
jgi:hypothetical protein